MDVLFQPIYVWWFFICKKYWFFNFDLFFLIKNQKYHGFLVEIKAFIINDNYADDVLDSIIISEEENNTLKNNASLTLFKIDFLYKHNIRFNNDVNELIMKY